MIAINKAESQVIRERCPYAHIVRTMKQKSKRHHYYCEESRGVMEVLRELRGLPQEKPKRPRHKQKRGGYNGGFKSQARRVKA